MQVTGPGAGSTRDPQLSGDGRTVAFRHPPTGTFGLAQFYVHNLETGETEPVTVSHDGEELGNFLSNGIGLSHDGALVVFSSGASNLVEGDTNGRDDIFVRDRAAGVTERVTMAPGGGQIDDHASLPVISPDGRFIAFHSRATNLVAGTTNGQPDLFIHDPFAGAPEARFAVADLEVRQPVVRPDQPAIVTARVKNIGALAGKYDAVLRVDGRVEDTIIVTVEPDSWSAVTFRVRRSDPGDYEVALGPAATRFTVTGTG